MNTKFLIGQPVKFIDTKFIESYTKTKTFYIIDSRKIGDVPIYYVACNDVIFAALESELKFKYKRDIDEFKKKSYNREETLYKDSTGKLVRRKDCEFILLDEKNAANSFVFVNKDNPYLNINLKPVIFTNKLVDTELYRFLPSSITVSILSKYKTEYGLDINREKIKLSTCIQYNIILDYFNNKPQILYKPASSNIGKGYSKFKSIKSDIFQKSSIFPDYMDCYTAEGIKIRRLSDRFGYNYEEVTNEFVAHYDLQECLEDGYFYPKDMSMGKYNGYEEFSNVNNISGSKSSSFIGTEGLKYTFGVEIEMQKCFIPYYLRNELNICCVRDGSINNKQGDRNGGPEFVTGVLHGDSGLVHLNKICNEITKRGILDKSCGLHLHLGNFEFTDKFLVLSYYLGLKLQDEFFSVVPPSRRGSTYCSKLKDLDFSFPANLSKQDLNKRISNYYNELFKHLCGQYPDDKVNKSRQHPRGRTCGYDHKTPRYNWLNFVPAAFNNRGSESSKTLEFRVHSGTSNFNKIKNWLKVCMAFVHFVNEYPDEVVNNNVIINGKIHSLTLFNIIKKVFPKSSDKLISYLEDRKSKFENIEYNESEEYKENKKGVLLIKDLKTDIL
jgi:hypothetical protein